MRMGQICLQHQSIILMILSIYIYLHREENQSLAKYLKNTYIPVAYVRRWLCVAAPPPLSLDILQEKFPCCHA